MSTKYSVIIKIGKMVFLHLIEASILLTIVLPVFRLASETIAELEEKETQSTDHGEKWQADERE